MKYSDLTDTIESLVNETLKENDNDKDKTQDQLHELIDSLDLVIYYNKAWDVVECLRRFDSKALDQAEDYLNEIGTEYKGIDDLMVKLSFASLLNMAEQYLNNIESEAV